MPSFEDSIEVCGSREQIFALTQDYDRRLQWDPFLRSAELLDGAPASAPGVRVRCAAWYGMAMVTEYVSFNPPEVAAVRMTSGPMLLSRFGGSWRFTETEPGVVRVTFRYVVCGRPEWLRIVLDPILEAVFRRDMRIRLQCLQQFVENGGAFSGAPPQAG